VGVSVAGNVMESVSGTGLGAPVAVDVTVEVPVAVDVAVAVLVVVIVPPVGVMEVVSEMVGVLEGRGLLVVVAVRLGVWDGVAVDCIVGMVVGVDVVATAAAFADGRPAPIKMTRIPAKSRSVITLKKIPWVVGRSFKAKRVSKPRMLASAKWTAKT
jgi:hypothetical protein